MEFLEGAGQEIAASIIGEALTGRIASIPPDMIGGDGSGTAHLIANFKSKGAPSYSHMGPEAINVKVHKYKCFLNKKPSGKFKQKPHGYEKYTRTLFDTRRDCILPKDRLALVSESGFSQGLIDILDSDSATSVEDLHLLTNCDKKLAEFRREKEREKSRAVSALIKDKQELNETTSRVKVSLAQHQLGNLPNTRIYSKVLNLRTKLEVHSDVTCYNSQVRIHLCAHTKYTTCEEKDGVLTAEQIYLGILSDIDSEECRSIKQAHLLKKERSNKSRKGVQIKRSLLVAPGTKVLDSETLIDNVQVIRSFNFQLKPSEVGIIDLTHNFPKGIDLFDLERCQINEAAATTFFIIEAVGDSSARITNKKYPTVKYNGISPLTLRYEILREITFIAPEKEKDVPATIRNDGPNRNFDDGTLAEMFYPSRKPPLTIDRKDLDIGGNNKKANYTLDLDTRSLLNPTLLDRVQSVQNNNYIDLEDAVNFEKMINETKQDLYDSVTESHKDYYKDLKNNNSTTEEDDDDDTINLDS